MNLDRRGWLKNALRGSALAALAPVIPKPEKHTTPIGAEHPTPRADAVGMLYDATICTGCKACVSACTEANGLVPDTKLSGGLWQMPVELNAHTKNIIKLYEEPGLAAFSYVKYQCMHCLDPACVSGCPFDALHKDEWGVVQWEASRCIGCRMCEVACPFLVPKFEWDRFNPKIVKCEFCHFRLVENQEPACTAVCPTHAVIFGTREDLLKQAKNRIAASPGKYFEDRVYGEKEAGGTQVLYLSHVPFEKIGLPKLGSGSAANYAVKMHQHLYKFFAAPILAFSALFMFVRRSFKEHQEEAAAETRASGLPPQL